ncbi:MAG: hypothetical protein MRY75_05900 [Marivita sp.]|uniref:hypothetical protein n=1 Tax=Marivita sp. TaxID=2003365 RepID=UPI0025C08F53|nr:hypothetical protein [Marivita sp.]MCI5110069.1 hypothetical protein [Marivita sp.]
MPVPETQSPDQPLRKSAQRLRWFVDAFDQQVRNTEAQTGNAFSVDRGALAQVFAEWLKAFEAQKPTRDDDKPAYVGFAAGLMLRTLIKHKPVALISRPDSADDSNPAYFWPEGYLYVAFCLNVRGLVLETDFHSEQHPSDRLNESRTWWSFRENVEKDPSLAIAFLDLFAGDEPEWSMPELFRTGRAVRIAERFYARESLEPETS